MRWTVLIITLLTITGAAAVIQNVYPREVDDGPLVVTLYHTDANLHDVNVQVYVPYADRRGRASVNHIRSGRAARAYVDLDTGNVEPGYYPVIVTLNEDGFRERKGTWVYIN